MITQERLRELLSYDPERGRFIRRVSVGPSKAGDTAGTLNKTGYRTVCVDRVLYLEHRLVWLYFHGSFPPQDIDHIDRDKANNRIENLRPVCRGENMINTKKTPGSASQFKGVYWNKPTRKWQARLNQKHLGLFSLEANAAQAYLFAVEERYG